MGVLLKLNFLQLELIQLEDLPVLESIAVRELMEGGGWYSNWKSALCHICLDSRGLETLSLPGKTVSGACFAIILLIFFLIPEVLIVSFVFFNLGHT